MSTEFTPAPALIGGTLIGLSATLLYAAPGRIAGYCPGPALANLTHATTEAIVFIAALLADSTLCRWASRA